MPAASSSRARQLPRQDGTRLGIAIGFSLLVHALILSLQFGIPGIGLPTLEVPWKERRAQAVDLNVSLAPPQQASMNRETSAGTGNLPTVPASEANPSAATPPSHGLKIYRPEALLPPPTKPAKPLSVKSAKAGKTKPAAPQTARRKTPSRAKVEQPVIALNETRPENFVVTPPALDEIEPLPATPPETSNEPTPFSEADLKEQEAAATQARALEEQQRAEEERQHQQEAEESARRAAEALALQQQQEELRRMQVEEAAKEEEAHRQKEEETRKLAERQAVELAARQQVEEAARQQAEAMALQQREEAARQALELEHQREEMRRQEAANAEREAMELAARKQAEETAREQAAQLARRKAEELAAKERERELTARKQAEAETAVPPVAVAPSAQRGAELVLGGSPAGDRPEINSLPKNLTGGLAGKALDQARRPEMLPNTPLAHKADDSANDTRRRSVFGSKDRDVGLIMYVESWRMKIERNGNLNYAQSSVDKARGDPVVTVSIRSDGSVEDVIINRSSGRSELDEAVRRIVRINARYSSFPPELARRFDVIEIRRIWSFDDKLRILEEVR